MPRRFLTVEDVHRANAGEIVVEEGTVVTPQALEAAEGAGIVILEELEFARKRHARHARHGGVGDDEVKPSGCRPKCV